MKLFTIYILFKDVFKRLPYNIKNRSEFSKIYDEYSKIPHINAIFILKIEKR